MSNSSNLYLDSYNEPNNTDGEISQLHHSNWWKLSKSYLNPPKDESWSLLPIIIYVDGTLLDALGKYIAKPLCVTIGNLSLSYRVCEYYILLSYCCPIVVLLLTYCCLIVVLLLSLYLLQ